MKRYNSLKRILEGKTEKIYGKSFLFYCLCFKSRSRLDYKKKLDQAAAQIKREMDLGRFLQKQRQLTIAVLSLLSGR